MDENGDAAVSSLRDMGAYQWGYMGGRLAREISQTIANALTGEALDAVLRGFRHTLDDPPGGSPEPTARGPEVHEQTHYS